MIEALWEKRISMFAQAEKLSSSLSLKKVILCSKRFEDKERWKLCKACECVKERYKEHNGNWKWMTLGWLINLLDQGFRSVKAESVWLLPSVSEQHNQKFGSKWAVITWTEIYSLLPGFLKLYVPRLISQKFAFTPGFLRWCPSQTMIVASQHWM